MLNEEQKSLIRAEETFRDAVRAEFAADKGERSAWQKVVDFLNMPIGGWVPLQAPQGQVEIWLPRPSVLPSK